MGAGRGTERALEGLGASRDTVHEGANFLHRCPVSLTLLIPGFSDLWELGDVFLPHYTHTHRGLSPWGNGGRSVEVMGCTHLAAHTHCGAWFGQPRRLGPKPPLEISGPACLEV